MRAAPVATYRLQFRDGMTFDRAVGLVPYLQRLGVSHLYASPIFAAVSGSTHGYDVVDHNRIDPALGGHAGFERLHAALARAGMGIVLDIVPNHMAASLENGWWRSVVEHGAASPYAHHFDIDWSQPLTLPVLGRPFDEALAAGELRLEVDRDHGCLAIACFGNLYPLRPETCALVGQRLGLEVGSLLAGADGAATAARLSQLSRDTAFMRALHEAQHWRLTFWKDARRHLSYRRFFEVTGLVGVSVEDDRVFDDVHRLVLSLVREGLVDGLRVDHVDGLARPGSYLRRLRAEVGPEIWLLVEKILGEDEMLPRDWPDCGTTGYEFVPAVAELLVDGEGLAAIRQDYRQFAGETTDPAPQQRQAKLLILRRNFEGELWALAALATELLSRGDQPAGEVEAALVEIIAGFDVYRTYGEDGELSAEDAMRLAAAVEAAIASGHADGDTVAAIAALLSTGGDGTQDAIAFRTRFQQLTGPVMAKAIEDTLFYRHNPLIALNEVGSAPGASPGEPHRFHCAMRQRADGPPGLVATATHDTKRGEDARARLYALTERPDLWSDAVRRWHGLRAGRCPLVEPAVEWLVYQMLAGIWPYGGRPSAETLGSLADRLLPAVEKALREAKLRTDWLEIDEAYEKQALDFVRSLLDPDNGEFLDDFTRTMKPLIRAGAVNALSQTLAKLTVPGVPDIYQGAEMLDLALVDPDNRRPVDFAALAAALDRALEAASPATLPIEDGSLKQALIAACLRCRREHPALFLHGDYRELPVEGPARRSFAAFARTSSDEAAVVLLRRFPLSQPLQAADLDASGIVLPPALRGRTFGNVLDGRTVTAGERIAVSALCGDLPVGMGISIRPA